jgi:hypothetical protein
MVLCAQVQHSRLALVMDEASLQIEVAAATNEPEPSMNGGGGSLYDVDATVHDGGATAYLGAGEPWRWACVLGWIADPS